MWKGVEEPNPGAHKSDVQGFSPFLTIVGKKSLDVASPVLMPVCVKLT